MPFSAQTTVALVAEGEEGEVLVIVEGKRRHTLRAGRNEALSEWLDEIWRVLESLRQDAVGGSAARNISPGLSFSPRFQPGKLVSGRL